MFSSEVKRLADLKYERSNPPAIIVSPAETMFKESSALNTKSIINPNEIKMDFKIDLKIILMVKINAKKRGIKKNKSW